MAYETEIETVGMQGWAAGIGLARRAPESARQDLRAIVARLLEAEGDLAAWIARVAPTLLDAGGFPNAWRFMVDGLRRGILDAATQAMGGAEQLRTLPWWTPRAEFDAEQVRMCQPAEALDDQEEFEAADAED